jgi:putative membrane protein
MKVIGIWLITAIAIAVAVWLVPGIEFPIEDKWISIGILAALLALLNTFIRPILQVVSLPITILTLGIFALIVNTVVLYLAAWLSDNLFGVFLHIDSFVSALIASVVISLVTIILNAITGIKDTPSRSRR